MKRKLSELIAARVPPVPPGTAAIGGTWSPVNYLDAYLRSARILVDKAESEDMLDDLAVAVVYQQRHSLELMLKDVLLGIYEIVDLKKQLAEDSGKTYTGFEPTAGALKRVDTGHRLSALLIDLEHAIAQTKRQGLPADLRALVADFEAIEAGEPTRFRYERVPGRSLPSGKHGPLQRSFPVRVHIDIRGFQTRLEGISAALFRFSKEDATETASIGEDIYLETNWLMTELYGRGLLE